MEWQDPFVLAVFIPLMLLSIGAIVAFKVKVAFFLHCLDKVFKTKNVHPVLSWLTLLGAMVSYAICGVSIHSLFYFFKCMSSLKQEDFEIKPINRTIPPIRVWDMAPNQASSDSFLLLNVYIVDSKVDTDCLARFNNLDETKPDPGGVYLNGKLLYSGATLLKGNNFILSDKLKYILSFWLYQSLFQWIANQHDDVSMLLKLLCKKIWNMESIKSAYILGNKVVMRHVRLNS